MSNTHPWELTEHICGQCLGRVLERTADDGTVIARCPDCEIEKPGGHRSICTCGLTLRTGKAAGFYCARNDKHKPGKTQEIVGLFDEAVCGICSPPTR